MRLHHSILTIALLAAGVAYGQSDSASSVRVPAGGIPATPPSPTGAANANRPNSSSERTPGVPLTGAENGGGAQAASDQDRRFVANAQMTARVDVDAARLAAKRSRDGKIQLFAREVEHNSAPVGNALGKLARAAGIKSGHSGESGSGVITMLDSAEGEGFDGHYARWAFRQAKAEQSLYENEATSGLDKSLRDYARLQAQKLAVRVKSAELIRDAHADKAEDK